MIESLTPEQEAKIPLYIEKWVNIGISTEPFSQSEAESIVWNFQTEILKQAKTPVVVCDNPVDAWNQVLKSGLNHHQIVDLAIAKVWSLVNANVEKPLRDLVYDQVDYPVSDLVFYKVRNQIWKQVWFPLGKQFEEQLESQIEDFVWPLLDGVYNTPSFGYYDYFISEGVVKIDEKLKAKFNTWSAISKLGLIYLLPDYCVVTQKFTAWVK